MAVEYINVVVRLFRVVWGGRGAEVSASRGRSNRVIPLLAWPLATLGVESEERAILAINKTRSATRLLRGSVSCLVKDVDKISY